MKFDLYVIVMLFQVIVLVSMGGWAPTTPPHARGASLALLLLLIATFVLWVMGRA